MTSFQVAFSSSQSEQRKQSFVAGNQVFKVNTDRLRESKRDRERERQTDRQTDRWTEREGRERDRERQRDIDRERQREERNRVKERDRERESFFFLVNLTSPILLIKHKI